MVSLISNVNIIFQSSQTVILIKRTYKAIIDIVENLEFVELYFLTGGKHPNNYDPNMLKGVEINHLEFKRLLDKLN